jgi:GTPase
MTSSHVSSARVAELGDLARSRPKPQRQVAGDDDATWQALLSSVGPRSERLAAEVDAEGGVEYKLHLSGISGDRFQGLLTQCMWRLREGGGRATYLLGVADDGVPVGIPPTAMRHSIATVRAMAADAGATVTRVTLRRGWQEIVSPGMTSGSASAAGDDDGEEEQDESMPLIAEVNLSKDAATAAGSASLAGASGDGRSRAGSSVSRGGGGRGALAQPELRLAVVGPLGSGKSTWIACVTSGCFDDGRGSARGKVFRHPHEVFSGRTSSIGRHLIGFDRDGALVSGGGDKFLGLSLASQTRHAPVSPALTAVPAGRRDSASTAPPSPALSGQSLVGAAPVAEGVPDLLASGIGAEDIAASSSSLITLLDLAGDSRYLRSMLAGLLGSQPDCLQIMVDPRSCCVHAGAAGSADVLAGAAGARVSGPTGVSASRTSLGPAGDAAASGGSGRGHDRHAPNAGGERVGGAAAAAAGGLASGGEVRTSVADTLRQCSTEAVAATTPKQGAALTTEWPSPSPLDLTSAFAPSAGGVCSTAAGSEHRPMDGASVLSGSAASESDSAGAPSVDVPSGPATVVTSAGGVAAGGSSPQGLRSTSNASALSDGGGGGASPLPVPTQQHIALAVALGLPFYFVLSHADCVTEEQMQCALGALSHYVGRIRGGGSHGRVAPASAESDAAAEAAGTGLLHPLVWRVRTAEEGAAAAHALCTPPAVGHTASTSAAAASAAAAAPTARSSEAAPVPTFCISSVTGSGFDPLLRFLSALRPLHDWAAAAAAPPAFQVQEVLSVEGCSVVAGLVTAGVVQCGAVLMLGPDPLGSFAPVRIGCIHVKRTTVDTASAGQLATFQLMHVASNCNVELECLRRGHVLVAATPIASDATAAAGVEPTPALEPTLPASARLHGAFAAPSTGFAPGAAVGCTLAAAVPVATDFVVAVHVFHQPGLPAFLVRAGKDVVAYCGAVRQPARVLSVRRMHAPAASRAAANGPHSAAAAARSTTGAISSVAASGCPPGASHRHPARPTVLRISLRFLQQCEVVPVGAAVVLRDGQSLAAGAVLESHAMCAPKPRSRHAGSGLRGAGGALPAAGAGLSASAGARAAAGCGVSGVVGVGATGASSMAGITPRGLITPALATCAATHSAIGGVSGSLMILGQQQTGAERSLSAPPAATARSPRPPGAVGSGGVGSAEEETAGDAASVDTTSSNPGSGAAGATSGRGGGDGAAAVGESLRQLSRRNLRRLEARRSASGALPSLGTGFFRHSPHSVTDTPTGTGARSGLLHSGGGSTGSLPVAGNGTFGGLGRDDGGVDAAAAPVLQASAGPDSPASFASGRDGARGQPLSRRSQRQRPGSAAASAAASAGGSAASSPLLRGAAGTAGTPSGSKPRDVPVIGHGMGFDDEDEDEGGGLLAALGAAGGF